MTLTNILSGGMDNNIPNCYGIPYVDHEININLVKNNATVQTATTTDANSNKNKHVQIVTSPTAVAAAIASTINGPSSPIHCLNDSTDINHTNEPIESIPAVEKAL